MSFLLDGRLSLTTPEGVRLQLTPAGPAVRAYAWAIDFAVWGAGTALLATLLGAIVPSAKLSSGLFSIGLFLAYWAYPVLCEVYAGGRTLGKYVVGLQVLRADGLPLRWRESVLRNLLLVADFLPIFYASGLLSMLCDRHFRRLGDIVAGTQVVYRDKAPQRVDVPDATPLPLPFPLTVEQQRALADLFARESRLPHGRMLELADIAAPLTGREGEASLERLRGMAAGLVR
ncbi:RDD family protein [Pseudoduganella violaceinigra]|uniref:RDD family protein n=1 Tax=Pseudoduganella violaceinigra TaxID=246602 RepID=UPI00048015E4|nr:RDD family protein [Pseudoduganella violaceinigra]